VHNTIDNRIDHRQGQQKKETRRPQENGYYDTNTKVEQLRVYVE